MNRSYKSYKCLGRALAKRDAKSILRSNFERKGCLLQNLLLARRRKLGVRVQPKTTRLSECAFADENDIPAMDIHWLNWLSLQNRTQIN